MITKACDAVRITSWCRLADPRILSMACPNSASKKTFGCKARPSHPWQRGSRRNKSKLVTSGCGRKTAYAQCTSFCEFEPGGAITRLKVRCFLQALMQDKELTRLRTSEDLISSILNWVCPECGGRMGGPGNEFICHGKCKTNWRPVWERVFVSVARQRATLGRKRLICH